MVASRIALLVAVAASPAVAEEALCSGDYADDPAVLAPRAREVDRDPANQYTYCLRATATYECLSYAPDGTIRRARRNAVAHGTAFAYKRAAETLLLTNDHVASWPAVTDEDHRVEDVPAGCKLVADALRIVDNEEDAYEANDVALSRVIADPELDVAILRARAPMKALPWRIGKSAAIRAGNAVAAQGFPLGAFKALNLGKVVNAYDHDTSRDWDHVDFVVDALLSPGNSGSPVLAISCRTGEYELVGIYHAGYTRGSALNVVIGIDQVRDLMMTLRRSPRVTDAGEVGSKERELLRALAPRGSPSSFPFGPLVAAVRARPDGALVFEVYTKGFPLRDDRLLIVEDLPRAGAFGEIGAVWIGNRRGLRPFTVAKLDGEAQAQLARVVGRLRAAAVSTARWRAADPSSQGGAKRQKSLERQRDRQASIDRDATQLLGELSERLGPRSGEKALAAMDLFAPPPPPPVATRPEGRAKKTVR